MAHMSVQVWDATGNKRQEVELPDDAPVNRILAVLLEKMRLPQTAPDGQPLSYKFHHKRTGRQLLDEQCLGEAGVQPGDVLRLNPEITAGAPPKHTPGQSGGRTADDLLPPPNPDPRLKPVTPSPDLLKIARFQKGVLVCLLFQALMLFGTRFVAPNGSPETASSEAEVPILQLSALLLVSIASAVFALRLGRQVYGLSKGTLFGIAAFFPGVSLLILSLLNHSTTQIFKSHGIKVGLLGARLASISR